MDKRARVGELVRRLEAARPAASAAEALQLVTTVLDAIEDHYSGVPNDPSSPRADERIWPPIEKYRFALPDRPDLEGYRQRGHETILGSSGAILIRARKGGGAVLDKAGHDGRKVNL
jgi:hypothetical protein